MQTTLLRGSLPEIGVLPELVSASFDFNQFSGPIPVQGAFAKLKKFGCLRNRINGTISSSFLSKLALIDTLNFGGNQLTGTIPDSFDATPFLKFLDLNGNSVSGTIPPSLLKLANLNFLRLSYNQMTGTIPGTSSSAKFSLGISF